MSLPISDVVEKGGQFHDEQIGTFGLANDTQALFDVHPHNIFLVKISKWLSL